jgi:acyl-CoA thioesterase
MAKVEQTAETIDGETPTGETTDTDFHDLGFIQFLGVEGRENADGRTVVALTPQRRHLNHNGDLHAAVLFGLAETAGVGAAVSGVMDLLGTSFVVVRDAQVEFLARARGTVAEFVATGTVEPDEYATGCAAARAGEPTELRSVAEVADPDGKACLRVAFTIVVRPRRT